MHMLVWFLIKLLNASHLSPKHVVLNHLLINENLFNVFLQDILEMQSGLHKYLVFSQSLHCVFVPFATVVAPLWVTPVLWMAWQAGCTPRTRSCTIWTESSVFSQRWSAPSIRWLQATKNAMFISCPIWCFNQGNNGHIVAYALIYFDRSISPSWSKQKLLSCYCLEAQLRRRRRLFTISFWQLRSKRSVCSQV